MRSDNDKKPDPNRDIKDFLSKFDDAEDIPADLNSYLTDEDKTEEPDQGFKWKDIILTKASGKAKGHRKDERMVTKDPAPSSIKVQRVGPEAVAPVPASDVIAALERKKKSQAEDIINEHFGDEPEDSVYSETEDAAPAVIESADESEEPTELDEFTESSDSNESSAPNVTSSSLFGGLLSIFRKTDEEAPESPAEDETNSESDIPETAAAAAATEVSVIPASSAFDLKNIVKIDRTSISNDYIHDPATDSYIKVDRGKRKRIEYKDIPANKKHGLSLFGAKAKDKSEKQAKEPKTKRTAAEVLFLKKNKNYNPEEGATYELNGKVIKNKPLKFSFLKLFRDLVIVGFLMMLVLAGAIAYLIHKSPEYNYNDVYATVATASIVYNDEGKQIDNIYYTENRRIVKYEDMPQDLIDSFVAIEDKTFWKHHGFNFTRMIGAILSSITGHGRVSGTSTITQQLARNVYLPEEKSNRDIKRKIREMYYAARLEHALSKEEIIEAYLNTIYLGFGCYGVNSAAGTYYSKSVKDLSLLECASLAALPQAPHNYALLKNASEGGEVSEDSKVISKSPEKIITNDISKDRRDLTLDLMLEQEYITKDEYDEAYNKDLNSFINPTLRSTSSPYVYFHDYLVDTLIADLMEQKNLSYDDAERMVYTGGLQIYSTVDSTAQKVVVDEFRDDDNFPFVAAIYNQDGDGNILNNDGKIALYDYDDYFDEDDNFIFRGDNGDIKFHDDGSATIYKDKNVYIYETDVNGQTDYSIEFKNYYVYEDETIFSIQGGFINIPSEFKSADPDGNVKVSADFFNDERYKEAFKRDGNNLLVNDDGYDLGRRTRQPQASMTIVEVGTGQVKAMAGGRQFNGQKLLNRAITPRQPGSSIKPLTVYGAALQRSYELQKEGKKWTYTDYHIDRQGTKGWGDYVTVHSSIEDERTKINGKYWPKNASGGFSGKNNFRTAIQNSLNTCAVKLLMQLGAENAITQLKQFGITTYVDTDENKEVNDVNSAAMALGAMTEGVTSLEMALAYAAFPGGGKVNTPICYTKVLDRNGNLLLEGKSEQTEALNEGVAWIMTDVLQSVVSKGICWGAAIDGISVGGKTGTTNDEYDIWFDGFTPSYAAALWIGTDNNITMGTTSHIAATCWSKIMSQIPKALEGEYREQPDNVIYKWGDYYTEGTEIGLSSWSYAEMKKKARDAAYKKWSSQRESHKKKVVDEKAHYEVTQEAYDVIYKRDSKGNVIKDSNGNPIVEKKVRNPSKDVKVLVPEKWHWEYESGWRDGDFTYQFDGHTYSD